MTDVLALDDEVVCKEEERDEYAPLLTDDYEVKEGILNVDDYELSMNGLLSPDFENIKIHIRPNQKL